MALSDKELKKLKQMMPGAAASALKNIMKGQRERNKADRHPPKSKLKTVPRTKQKTKKTAPRAGAGKAKKSDIMALYKRMKKR
tara:strand:+ start:7235 stop:7483 length:249 start_codon:yes stop_codon:yes gene_type:complete